MHANQRIASTAAAGAHVNTSNPAMKLISICGVPTSRGMVGHHLTPTMLEAEDDPNRMNHRTTNLLNSCWLLGPYPAVPGAMDVRI